MDKLTTATPIAKRKVTQRLGQTVPLPAPEILQNGCLADSARFAKSADALFIFYLYRRSLRNESEINTLSFGGFVFLNAKDLE
jgi:hypothetical protein